MRREPHSRIDQLVKTVRANQIYLLLASTLLLLTSSCSKSPSKPEVSISVTVATDPAGLSITVDGSAYTSPHVFSWARGSAHTAATTPTQSPVNGTQYTWDSWSDGGELNHAISPTTDTIYTANFATQYQLTTTVSPSAAGTITLDPTTDGNWYSVGQQVQIQATSGTNHNFLSWTGSGSGSYTGPDNPTSVVMNAPLAQTANFADATITVTVQAWPPGQLFTVDGVSYSSHQIFNWITGSNHTIATSSQQVGGADTRYLYSGWSDGGAIDHSVSPTTDTLYTANFATQYRLTTVINPSGIGSISLFPATVGNWYDAGLQVQLQANPANSFSFLNWVGNGSGSYTGADNPAIVFMNSPIVQSANFSSAAGNVIVESKSFQSGSPVCRVGVYVTNSEPITALVLPLELRSITPNAFPSTSFTFQMNPGGRVYNSPLGPEGESWPAATVTTRRYAVAASTNCSGPTSSSYAVAAPQIDFVSPDAVLHAAVSLGDTEVGQSVSLPPGSDPIGVPSFWFTFGVAYFPGRFVIDTCCVRPDNHLSFVNEAVEIIAPQFQRGIISIYVE